MPRDASHRISGIVRMTYEDWGSISSKRTATPEAKASGPPMSPSIAIPLAPRRSVHQPAEQQPVPEADHDAGAPMRSARRPTAMKVDSTIRAPKLTERANFAVPPQDRQQRDHRAEVRDDEEELEKCPLGHMRVRTGAGDVALIQDARRWKAKKRATIDVTKVPIKSHPASRASI
jgi:hypothetical protein